MATNFPNGLASRGIPLPAGPSMPLSKGTVFHVDSGHGQANDSNSGKKPGQPLATLDAAVGKCSANNGDVILVSEGHSETYTAAGDLSLDVAGITIIGLGIGDARPTFLLDAATTVDIDVTAADIKIVNCRFGFGHADVVEGFDLSADGFTLEDVEFYDNAASENVVDFIKTAGDNTCDRLTLIRVRAISPDTGNDALIEVNGDLDQLIIVDSFISLGTQDSEAIVSVASGKDLTNAYIVGNSFYRLNTAGDIVVDSDTTANSGIVAHNFTGHADTGSEIPFDITGARLFENYSTAANDTSGYILPAVDS